MPLCGRFPARSSARLARLVLFALPTGYAPKYLLADADHQLIRRIHRTVRIRAAQEGARLRCVRRAQTGRVSPKPGCRIAQSPCCRHLHADAAEVRQPWARTADESRPIRVTRVRPPSAPLHEFILSERGS